MFLVGGLVLMIADLQVYLGLVAVEEIFIFLKNNFAELLHFSHAVFFLVETRESQVSEAFNGHFTSVGERINRSFHSTGA